MPHKMTVLTRPFGPAVVLIAGSLLLFAVDRLSLAFIIGTGAASMLLPSMMVGTVLTGVVAKSWWHSVAGVAVSYGLSRLIFIRRLNDVTVGYETAAFAGAIFIGLLAVGVISGLRFSLARMKSRTG